MPAEVIEAYLAALRECGNPASMHADGQSASERLEGARERIASALGCERAELVLTSGGTESINLALKGMFWARRRAGSGPVVLIGDGEHHATLEAAEWLRDAQGAELEIVPLDAAGLIQPEAFARRIEEVGPERVALASVMLANNEVGSVNPVSELCRIAAGYGIPVHVDAVAALGQIRIDFASLGAAALSVSAHKIGGPPGVGALALGRHHQIESLLHGGSQQRGRSGTQDAAGAVGFAAALEVVVGADGSPRSRGTARIAALRDSLIERVREIVPDAVLRGPEPGLERLPGNAHFTFPGCQGDSLLFLLDAAGISVSVGSACQAGVAELSHVLLAMGVPEAEAAGALRFTLGHDTRGEDIDALVLALPDAVARARSAGLA